MLRAGHGLPSFRAAAQAPTSPDLLALGSYVREETLEAARDAVVATAAYPDGYSSLSAVVEDAVREKVQELQGKYAGGSHSPLAPSSWHPAGGRIGLLGVGQVAVERCPRHTERPADLSHRRRLVGVEPAGHRELLGGKDPRPAAVSSSSSGRLEAGGSALADEVALELCQGREDVKDQFAAGRGRVQRLVQGEQPDPPVLELGHEVEEMAQGATEPVEAPDDEGVAAASEAQGLLKPGSVGTGAAGSVREDALAASAFQGLLLQGERLVGR